MRLDDLPLREELRGKAPYGAPQAPLPIALNVNENTHPVPEEVADDILDSIALALREVNRYPDREFVALRESFADYLGHGVTAEQVWAANGSNEVLQHVLQAFAGPGRTRVRLRAHLLHVPAAGARHGRRVDRRPPRTRLHDHPGGCRRPGRRCGAGRRLPLRAEQPDRHADAPRRHRGGLRGHHGIVIVDEAYQEFAPHEERSALTLLPERPRLVVSRTMSKAFAFAGARVGYLAADPAVVDALRLVRLPYHLSALTQAAALAALRHAPVMLGMVDEIVSQRDRMSATLEALGYRPYESWTNFVLFGGVDDPAATWQALYDQGVLIRDIGLPGCLRVTAGTEEETTAFLEALASVDSGA